MTTSASIRTFITSGHDVKAMASCGPDSNCAAPLFQSQSNPDHPLALEWKWLNEMTSSTITE